MAIPKADWEAAKHTEELAKAALRDGVEAVAKRARRSERSIYRLLARYRLNPTLLAFLPRKRGVAAGSRRLNSDHEAIIAEAVERWLASREPQPIARAVEGARVLAKAAGLKPNATDLRFYT